jgi:hypothetical protein
MTQGRGAWTPRGKQNGSIYYQFKVGSPFDGTEPSEDAQGHLPEDPLGIEDYSVHAWYDRAHRGVKGLQILLRANGFTDAQVPLNGIFDEDLSKIVIVYQARYPERVGAADVTGPANLQLQVEFQQLEIRCSHLLNERLPHDVLCLDSRQQVRAGSLVGSTNFSPQIHLVARHRSEYVAVFSLRIHP